MTKLRIGHGYDVHRLAAGRSLILGGVTIPYDRGLDGHSDADVLTHAVMDALLGAAALGDIGQLSAASWAARRHSSGTGPLMARAGSPGSRVNTSGHTAGHNPHWIHVFAWTIACMISPLLSDDLPVVCPEAPEFMPSALPGATNHAILTHMCI